MTRISGWKGILSAMGTLAALAQGTAWAQAPVERLPLILQRAGDRLWLALDNEKEAGEQEAGEQQAGKREYRVQVVRAGDSAGEYWLGIALGRLPDVAKEQLYERCYGPEVAREMKNRLRERKTLDALDDLVVFLQGVRDERKAILTVSEGWLLYSHSELLAKAGGGAPAPRAGNPCMLHSVDTYQRRRANTDGTQESEAVLDGPEPGGATAEGVPVRRGHRTGAP